MVGVDLLDRWNQPSESRFRPERVPKPQKNRLRQNRNLSSGFKPIGVVAAPRRKIPLSFFQKPCILPPSRLHRRGVSRSSRTWEAGCDGCFWRARRARSKRTAKTCGPGAATLALSFSVMIRRVTGAREPVPRGEHGISVNTIARGMPVISAEPVVTAACVLVARGPWVRLKHSAFPAPSWFFEGGSFPKASGATRRESKPLCLDIVIASAAKRSTPQLGERWIASLRSQ